MNFTSDNLKIIRQQINDTLKPLGKQLNIDLHAGKCTYNIDEATFKLKISSAVTKKQKENKQQKDFNDMCEWYGFEQTDYKRIFKFNNDKFKLIGFMPRARKYKCVGENMKTKQKYRFTTNTIKFC